MTATRTGWSRPYGSADTADGRSIPVSELATDTRPEDLVRLEIRWRHPGAANARRRTFPGPAGSLVDGLALLHALEDAWRNPDSVAVGTGGQPAHLPAGPLATTEMVDAQPPRKVLVGRVLRQVPRWEPAPTTVLTMPPAYEPARITMVGPDNALLGMVAAGQLALGPTVGELISETLRMRTPHWSAKHTENMLNVFALVDTLARYHEPDLDLDDYTRGYELARLELPGVDIDESMHARLLMPSDIQWLIDRRRDIDGRVLLLNLHAIARHKKDVARYQEYLSSKAAGTWSPRRKAPAMPPPDPPQRPEKKPCEARTEQLFAVGLREVLETGKAMGVFLTGSTPMERMRGTGPLPYRTPKPLLPSLRNTLTGSQWVDLAECIAKQGLMDRRRGVPTGDRYRALVIAMSSAARPTELARSEPGHVDLDQRQIELVGAQYRVGKSLTPDRSGIAVRNQLKRGQPGESRTAPLTTYATDAIERHLDRGYATDDRLFTALGRTGEPVPLDWSAILDTYWRPAVAKVLSRCVDPVLHDLQPRWCRKSAITWQLSAGAPPAQVAEWAGHDPGIMLNHYAGVVYGSNGHRRVWSGIDDAWNWFVTT